MSKADDLMDRALPNNVYVMWDPLRNGYAFILKELDKPQRHRIEIAFRPVEEARTWDRFYDVMGHVARRALKDKGLCKD